MTGRDKMPIGKYKGMPLADVPDDYWDWFKEQDWAKTKYPAIYKWCTEGDTYETPKEKPNLDQEAEILKDCSDAFKKWWEVSYGERLRKTGEFNYIPFLRVAKHAWNFALEWSRMDSKAVVPRTVPPAAAPLSTDPLRSNLASASVPEDDERANEHREPDGDIPPF